MANIKQAFEYAAQNPNSDFANNLKQLAASGSLNQEAEKYGIDLSAFQAKPTFMDKMGAEASRLNTEFRKNKTEAEVRQARGEQTGLETIGQTFGEAAKAAAGTIVSPLTVGVKEALDATGISKGMEEKAKATEAYIAEQKAINPNYDPRTDEKLNPFTAKQVQASKDMGIPEYNPSEREKANLGIATNIAGAAVDIAGALEGAGAVKSIVGSTAKGVATGAKQTAAKIASSPIVSGTGDVLQAAGRTLKSIPENIATNVGEMQAKEALIKSIPSVTGQKAVRAGVDVADATTLLNAIKTPEAKSLIQTVKDFSTGKTKTSPFEVVGKPIVARLKTLDEQVKNYATQLDSVAKDLKGVSIGDVAQIDKSVMEGLNKLQIGITNDGLNFVGSSLEGIGGSGKIIDNVFKRLQGARDAFDLHNLKKYIDANVSYGKRVEGLDAGAERLLKTWRKSIDDTLDNQFEAYNKVNTELAKRISPLEDLKGILKNADGLDTDLLSEKAGIIARRITSAAASNPEIKQILRNLDKFTSAKGKTLGKIENLQDLYNVLNKYYDIAPKTGFQNLVKEGTGGTTGVIEQATQKIQGFVGSTNATRQKALEDYLAELLTKPSKSKN